MLQDTVVLDLELVEALALALEVDSAKMSKLTLVVVSFKAKVKKATMNQLLKVSFT